MWPNDKTKEENSFFVILLSISAVTPAVTPVGADA